METGEENIRNIPNFLTALRVVIAFVLIYLILAGFNIIIIVVLFSAGMITDALDGQIARRYKMTTEFGRKFDMVADRILILGAVLAFVIEFSSKEVFLASHWLQMILILSREIISLPWVLWGLFSGRSFPQVRFIGKFTTVLQAITFPAILLSVFYSHFSFSFYLAIITSFSGAVSGIYYIKDVTKGAEK